MIKHHKSGMDKEIGILQNAGLVYLQIQECKFDLLRLLHEFVISEMIITKTMQHFYWMCNYFLHFFKYVLRGRKE